MRNYEIAGRLIWGFRCYVCMYVCVCVCLNVRARACVQMMWSSELLNCVLFCVYQRFGETYCLNHQGLIRSSSVRQCVPRKCWYTEKRSYDTITQKATSCTAIRGIFLGCHVWHTGAVVFKLDSTEVWGFAKASQALSEILIKTCAFFMFC